MRETATIAGRKDVRRAARAATGASRAMSKRPGLAKVKRAPLLSRRRADLVAPSAGRWREILEGADVVSEGQTREEAGLLYYYGTTSLLLPAGNDLAEEDLEELTSILRHDPHIRLRAVRVARREAASRAAAPLGPLRAEISLRATRQGVVVTVDVVARVRRASAGGGRR